MPKVFPILTFPGEMFAISINVASPMDQTVLLIPNKRDIQNYINLAKCKLEIHIYFKKLPNMNK